MKNKRWLFVLLSILFLINISFFVVTRFVEYDLWLMDIISNMIDEQLDSVTQIGSLSLSDRQLHLSDINISDTKGLYQIQVPHVYVNFNLFKLLFSNIKLFKVVEDVSIIAPEIRINLNEIERKKDPSHIDDRISLPAIPDLSDYFSDLSIVKGSLQIEYSDDNFSYRDFFPSFDLYINNNRTTALSLSLRREESINETDGESEKTKISPPAISVALETENNSLLHLNALFHDYKPTLFSVVNFDDTSFTLYLQAKYENGLFKTDGLLENLKAVYKERTLFADSIELFSLNERFFLHTENLLLDGNLFILDMEIDNILSNHVLHSRMQADDIPIEKYLPSLQGNIGIETYLTGSLFQPNVELTVSSNRILFNQEKIEDLHIKANYQSQLIDIELQNALWQDNSFQGKGIYTFDDGFRFNLKETDLSFQLNSFSFDSDIAFHVVYKDDLFLSCNLNNLSLRGPDITLADLGLLIEISGKEFQTKLKGNRFKLEGEGNLQEQSLFADLHLQGLNPNDIFPQKTALLKSYPHLHGRVDLSYNDGILHSLSNLRMYNLIYGELEGSFSSELTLDYNNNTSYLTMETSNTTYRYEQLSLFFEGEGTTDSLSSKTLLINNEIRGDFSLTTVPDLTYSLSLEGNDLAVRRYLKYFIAPYHATNFDGRFDLSCKLQYPDKFNGFLTGTNFSYKKIGPFNNTLVFGTEHDSASYIKETIQTEKNTFRIEEPEKNKTLSGKERKKRIVTDETIYFSNIIKSENDEPLIMLNGKTRFNPELDTEISLNAENFPLSDLMSDTEMQGSVNVEAFFKRENRSNELGLTLVGESCLLRWLENGDTNNKIDYRVFAADIIIIDALQNEEALRFKNVYVRKEGLYEMSLTGNLGYNILTNRTTALDDDIVFQFQGDLVKGLSDNLTFLQNGYSETEINMQLGIRQDELWIESGKLLLSGSNLKVQDQAQRIDDINIDILFEDNRMIINRFDCRIGEGRFYLRNEIKDNEYDFRIGMLQLGHFYARTSASGITVHIPTYFPHNTTGNVVVRGRNANEALITGPFDDIKITADLFLSNASVTYPPNTDNLFKIINIAADRRSRSEPEPLPLEFDLKLIANNQVRYVTYPLNLLMLSNSYIRLLYKNNLWIPADAFFAAESGSLDMFGTTFSLDYADFLINYDLDDYRLSGTFFRYASDGSLITLEIYNEANGGASGVFDNMQFHLKSDNPEDRTTLHVLSKLRYNRRLEDIPRSQQNALLQDEFLQLAGIGLTGAIVDPFIYPFINRTRQILRLDFFSIKPSLVENLVRTYGFNEQAREPEEESEIIQFGKNILLNNLSIAMGKFVTRDLYLDYEFLLQKPVDVVGERDLLLYHNFTFHYNLPYRLRFSYRFYLKPEGEKNSHELFVRRSFAFW